MIVNELRLGNFIFILKTNQIAQITTILKMGVLVNDNIFGILGFEDFKPIPLTEKWLLDFGFEMNENEVYQTNKTLMPLSITLSDKYQDEKYKAWVYEDENFSYHTISDNVKYVHQLQNLFFALKNKELTLNK